MKKKEILSIALFFTVICSAYLVWPLFRNHVDTENHENRDLAEFPKFNLTSINDFPNGVENYVNDHLPFRNQLVKLNGMINYFVFKTSTSDSVVIGRDGWLFYANKDDGDPIACYQGKKTVSEDELKLIAENLIKTRDNLAADGIDFAVLICPNKERVYSSEMPFYLGEPGEIYAVKQIYDYISANTDIKIVYPYDEFIQAQQNLGKNAILYHKTDTHWNELGAYIGTKALLEKFGIEMPAYNDENVRIVESDDTSGDLTAMLNMYDIISSGKTYTLEDYSSNTTECEIWEYYGSIRYHASDADPRKIMISRDSFGRAMSEEIATQFSSSTMIHRRIFTNDMVKEEKPDIFVLETVERYASDLLLSYVYE